MQSISLRLSHNGKTLDITLRRMKSTSELLETYDPSIFDVKTIPFGVTNIVASEQFAKVTEYIPFLKNLAKPQNDNVLALPKEVPFLDDENCKIGPHKDFVVVASNYMLDLIDKVCGKDKKAIVALACLNFTMQHRIVLENYKGFRETFVKKIIELTSENTIPEVCDRLKIEYPLDKWLAALKAGHPQ